jgi:hypothetical protein
MQEFRSQEFRSQEEGAQIAPPHKRTAHPRKKP